MLQAFDRDGEPDALAEPTGLFFTEDEHLYVCDQKNQRIVEFDEQMHYVRSIQDPTPELLPEGFAFYPSAVAVDKWGTVYCISYSSSQRVSAVQCAGGVQGLYGVAGGNPFDLSEVLACPAVERTAQTHGKQYSGEF